MPSCSRTGDASRTRNADHAGGEAGFTLVELLVVLSLIGLLTMAAPALISAARPAVDARTAAQALAAELRAARQAAVASGQPRDVVLDQASRGYRLLPDGRTRALPLGVALDADVAPGSTTIRFFADGSASGGRIRIASERRAVWVSVHWLSGKVTVHE